MPWAIGFEAVCPDFNSCLDSNFNKGSLSMTIILLVVVKSFKCEYKWIEMTSVWFSWVWSEVDTKWGSHLTSCMQIPSFCKCDHFVYVLPHCLSFYLHILLRESWCTSMFWEWGVVTSIIKFSWRKLTGEGFLIKNWLEDLSIENIDSQFQFQFQKS